MMLTFGTVKAGDVIRQAFIGDRIFVTRKDDLRVFISAGRREASYYPFEFDAMGCELVEREKGKPEAAKPAGRIARPNPGRLARPAVREDEPR